MDTSLSLAELLVHGVELSMSECVALTQALIRSDMSTCAARPPFGPPSIENLAIGPNGSVSCRGYAATPAVLEVAILLQTLLELNTQRVPGGLRYAIGRALLEVEVPPFDSLNEFSAAIERFEQGDRQQVLRRLYARGAAVLASPAAGVQLVDMVDRRRHSPTPTELRRQLRDADRELYLQLQARPSRVYVRPQARPARVYTRPPGPSWHGPLAAGLAAGVSLILAGEIMHSRRQPAQMDSQQDSAQMHVAPPVLQGPDRASPGNNRSETQTSVPQPAETRGPSVAGVQSAPADESIHANRREPAPLDRELLPGDNRGPAATRSTPAAATLPPAPARGAAFISESPAGEPSREDRRMRVASSAMSDGAVVRAVDSLQRPVFSPAFASNGTAMFFHTGRTGDSRSALGSVNTGTDDLRVMTIVDDGSRNYHVQPSPDGRMIAFDSDRDGERGVYIASSDGTGVRRVSGSGYAAVPTWSPNDDQLAFIRAEPDNPRVWNLWLLAVASGTTRRLTSFTYGQTWSASWFPDGRRVCYTHEDRVIILDLTSGQTREFASPVPKQLVRTPAVSPDGTKVMFQVFRHGAWLLDLNDGAMRCVLTDPTAEEFAWAPDGRRVAFHSRRDGQWGIWMMSGM